MFAIACRLWHCAVLDKSRSYPSIASRSYPSIASRSYLISYYCISLSSPIIASGSYLLLLRRSLISLHCILQPALNYSKFCILFCDICLSFRSFLPYFIYLYCTLVYSFCFFFLIHTWIYKCSIYLLTSFTAGLRANSGSAIDLRSILRFCLFILVYYVYFVYFYIINIFYFVYFFLLFTSVLCSTIFASISLFLYFIVFLLVFSFYFYASLRPIHHLFWLI